MTFILTLIYCIIWTICIYNAIVLVVALHSTKRLFDIDPYDPIKITIPISKCMRKEDLEYDDSNKTINYTLCKGPRPDENIILQMRDIRLMHGGGAIYCYRSSLQNSAYETIIDQLYRDVGETNKNLDYVNAEFDLVITGDLDQIEYRFNGIVMVPYDVDHPDFYIAYNGTYTPYNLYMYEYGIYSDIMFKTPSTYIMAKSQSSYYIKHLLLPIPKRFKYLRRIF